MPIVRARKAMKDLQAEDILEVHITNKGSVADFTAWADQVTMT